MDNSNTLILALGTGAQNVVNHFYEQNQDFNILCISQDKEVLEKSKTKTLCFDDVTTDYLWEQIFENKIKPHKRLTAKQIELLRKEFANYKNIIIVSALGGSFSSYLTSAMVELVTLLNLYYKVIVSFPFAFEGKKRTNFAQQAFNEVKEAGCIAGKNLFIYNNDTLLYGDDKEITNIPELFEYRNQMKAMKSIEDAFRAIDDEVSKILTMILH